MLDRDPELREYLRAGPLNVGVDGGCAAQGAQVFANFLLSPAAQAKKADIAVWGDPTVLAVDRLPAAQRALFSAPALPGQVRQPAPALIEPHGSWVEPLEKEWTRRYGG